MANDSVVLRTGIDSLDAILSGGIRFHKSAGLLGVITGAAGTGKSLLAMELCTKFACQQSEVGRPRSAIYASQDPPQLAEAKIRDMFNYFSPSSLNNPPAIVTGPFSSKIEPCPQENENQPTSLSDLCRCVDNHAAIYICQISLDTHSQRHLLENIIEIVSQTINQLTASCDNGA